MRMQWIRGMGAFGLGLAAMAGVARAQQPPPAAPAAGGQVRAEVAQAIERKPGDMPGPIDSLQDLQDTAKMAFMAADQNHDGLISQPEATDAGNLLVGGLFFAADINGDGTLTKEEAQAAREKVMRQNPLLRLVAQRAKQAAPEGDQAATNAARGLGNLLDANNDQKLEASELRQGVQSAVQGMFAVADTNRDNQLSPTELNAAVYSLASAAADAAFQAADANKDGNLGKDEFAKAIIEPANAVFDILDGNGDGQLSSQELDQAGRLIASRVQMFRIPQAANSPQELLENGQRPGDVAPAPRINAAPRGTPPPPARTTPPAPGAPRQ